MKIALIILTMICSYTGFSQEYYYPVKESSKKDSLIEVWIKKQKLTYQSGKYDQSILYFDSLLEQQGIQISYFSLRMAIFSSRMIKKERDFSFGTKVFGEQLMSEPWHLLNMKGNERPHEVVDEPPVPKGGMKKFLRYINSNLNYPQKAKENEIEGQVLVRFIVNKDGTIDGVCVLKGLSLECNMEAERLIRNGPMWKPGIKKGSPVYVKIVLTVTFSL